MLLPIASYNTHILYFNHLSKLRVKETELAKNKFYVTSDKSHIALHKFSQTVHHPLLQFKQQCGKIRR